MDESYSLTSARTHLGELVSRARYSHRPVAITEHGKPSVALINIDDLADLPAPTGPNSAANCLAWRTLRPGPGDR